MGIQRKSGIKLGLQGKPGGKEDMCAGWFKKARQATLLKSGHARNQSLEMCSGSFKNRRARKAAIKAPGIRALPGNFVVAIEKAHQDSSCLNAGHVRAVEGDVFWSF